jgi:putative transposase
MKRRFTDQQNIAMIREQEAGLKTSEVCRKHGISDATFYKYKAKFGGMTVSDARRLRALQAENARLKHLLAEAMLDNAALKDLTTKNF